jgi:hypothetical protein
MTTGTPCQCVPEVFDKHRSCCGDEDVDEEVEEPNIEAGGTAAPQCVADEGENIPRIVEQLRDKNREFDEVMNVDSSDDDEDVPEE